MDTERAFADFVAARSTALLRTAYLLTGDRALAEDLVQESLFAVYRNRARVREVAALEGYVRTTMVRTHISWRRRRSSGEIPSAELPDAGRAPDESPTLGDTWPEVLKLPPKQRVVVVLSYFEDLSETQIADQLGCTVGTVKSHRARALDTLRRQLGAAPTQLRPTQLRKEELR
ncbi:MAG TPA: SigE family RNA polymerase sigma factor [Nocardioidaceae bacterium]|nr:SigE family RNA polymerase sigma factor [Nocardioidaceae bacterium]